MYDRYAEIRTKLREAFSDKTSWGRNEIYAKIDETLIDAADEELSKSEATQPPWAGYTW